MQFFNPKNHPLGDARNQRLTDVLHRRQPDVTIILDNVQDPHNVAAVMRTCDAVGIMEIFLLNSGLPVPKRFNKRSSSGANTWMLAHRFNDAKECIDRVRQQVSKIYSTKLGVTSHDLYSLDFTEPIALVFGNETLGVSDEVHDLCDGNFNIPQMGMIQSLNISVACAVSLYEAYRQKNIAGHYDHYKLNEAQEKRLLEFWKVKK